MSSTQEKLEGKFEIEPGQILTIEANGYLKGTIISNDEDTLILSQSSLDQLIDSAKREELESLHETLLMNEDNPDPVKLIEHRIAQLQQSEESE